MMKNNRREELLNELAKKLNVIYLSDLSVNINENDLKEIVVSIPENKYDTNEWVEAIRYITHDHDNRIKKFDSVEDAKRYLLDFPF